MRVVRVKGTGWHRAILGDSLIKEDSDEYLQLRDDSGAEATADLLWEEIVKRFPQVLEEQGE